MYYNPVGAVSRLNLQRMNMKLRTGQPWILQKQVDSIASRCIYTTFSKRFILIFSMFNIMQKSLVNIFCQSYKWPVTVFIKDGNREYEHHARLHRRTMNYCQYLVGHSVSRKYSLLKPDVKFQIKFNNHYSRRTDLLILLIIQLYLDTFFC